MGEEFFIDRRVKSNHSLKNGIQNLAVHTITLFTWERRVGREFLTLAKQRRHGYPHEHVTHAKACIHKGRLPDVGQPALFLLERDSIPNLSVCDHQGGGNADGEPLVQSRGRS